MTDSRIRYIISGLKGEIRREANFERVEHLCYMGMYWSRQIMTNGLVINKTNTIVCNKCNQEKQETDFALNRIPYKDRVYVYRWRTCRECINKARRKIKGKGCKPPEKGPKMCGQCRELLPLAAFSKITYRHKEGDRIYRRNICAVCMSSNSLQRRKLKMLQVLTFKCG